MEWNKKAKEVHTEILVDTSDYLVLLNPNGIHVNLALTEFSGKMQKQLHDFAIDTYTKYLHTANTIKLAIQGCRRLQQFMQEQQIENIVDLSYADINNFATFFLTVRNDHGVPYKVGSAKRMHAAALKAIKWIQENYTDKPKKQRKLTKADKRVIGNSVFADDTWDLTSLDDNPLIDAGRKVLHFGYISEPSLKKTVKEFVYFHRNDTKPQSMQLTVNSVLPSFIRFCESEAITTWKQIDSALLVRYYRHMTEADTVRPSIYQTSISTIMKIIREGQTHPSWNVPKLAEIQEFRAARKAGYYQIHPEQKNSLNLLPRPVYDAILYHAIRFETNICVKASLIIQAETGLKIGEVFKLQEGCISKTFDGNNLLTVPFQNRNIQIMVNQLVVDVIHELEEYTHELRQESGLKELFLGRSQNQKNRITVQCNYQWNRQYRDFMRRWDICDKDGKVYHLTSTQFVDTYIDRIVNETTPTMERLLALYPYLPLASVRRKYQFFSNLVN